MALYRFLFAPVLLAVAVLTTSPHRSRPPSAPPVQVRAAVGPVLTAPSEARAPSRDSRVGPSRPGTVR